MTLAPIDLYDDVLAASADDRSAWLSLRYDDQSLVPLDVQRWRGPVDAADAALLARCADPTLDVGCGPGRLVAALAAAGGVALGVDIAESAVHLARVAGAEVVRQSVFEPLPAEGGWGSVILADGNIGIGGNPVGLLSRCGDLMRPDGHILVELDPPGSATASVTVRLETVREHSEWFTWAHVAADLIDSRACAAGLCVVDRWTLEGRWFASLAR
jgi:SAM-dependent methyltransferase